MEIHILADVDMPGMKITKGWESLYYSEKIEATVLEVTVGSSCSQILSIVEFK